MTNLNVQNVLNSIKETAASNSALSQKFAREEMAFNAEQAALNRAWQEKMSNTAHQREVKDLLAAGLNPVLSSGGSGASTPTGSSASGSMGKVDESFGTALANYASTLVSSAAQLQMAGITADAQKAAAFANAGAMRYSADVAKSGTIFSANSAFEGTKYSSDNYKSAAIWSSGIHAAGSIVNTLLNNFLGKKGQPNVIIR